MKKLIINCIVLTIVSLFVGCKSIPQEALTTPDYIKNYYASSDEECNCIFEFINQSNKQLQIISFIANDRDYKKYYTPLLSSSVQFVQPGECIEIKLNADKLIKDFGIKNCVGINCLEKGWSWWYTTFSGLKNKRIRIVVKDDGHNQGLMLYPPFKPSGKFEIQEIDVDYNNQKYKSYLLLNTPDKYKCFYDTRIFYSNKSNNSSRLSNIYTCSCLEKIQEFISNEDFTISTTEGYKVLTLNNDPLDLNNYILNDDYDFIYEIVNNSVDNISAANIILNDESKILGLSNDIEIEPGKSVQLKYNLNTLKKIYGEKSMMALDVKRTKDSKWIRDWKVDFNHKSDKYVVVVNEGTNGRVIDVFDLWKNISDLEKGSKIY